MFRIILSLWLIYFEVCANEAKNNYIKEYTYLGVSACIDKSQEKFSTKSQEGHLQIGSKEYFNYLAKCFSEMKKNCEKEVRNKNCETYKEMQKRLYATEIMKKVFPSYKSNKETFKDPKKEKIGWGDFHYDGLLGIDSVKNDEYVQYTDKEIEEIKKAYKEAKEQRKKLKAIGEALSCNKTDDCEALPVGHKFCGGPKTYRAVSKTSPNYQKLKSQLEVLSESIRKYHLMLKGISGLCDSINKPSVKCQLNKCVAF